MQLCALLCAAVRAGCLERIVAWGCGGGWSAVSKHGSSSGTRRSCCVLPARATTWPERPRALWVRPGTRTTGVPILAMRTTDKMLCAMGLKIVAATGVVKPLPKSEQRVVSSVVCTAGPALAAAWLAASLSMQMTLAVVSAVCGADLVLETAFVVARLPTMMVQPMVLLVVCVAGLALAAALLLASFSTILVQPVIPLMACATSLILTAV